MASKEIKLQYYSSDQEAAEHYHDVYTTMMNDLRILTSVDFLRIYDLNSGATNYIIVALSPIKYSELSEGWYFTIVLYTDETSQTRKDFMFSLIDYAMEKNVRSFQEHFLKNV